MYAKILGRARPNLVIRTKGFRSNVEIDIIGMDMYLKSNIKDYKLESRDSVNPESRETRDSPSL